MQGVEAKAERRQGWEMTEHASGRRRLVAVRPQSLGTAAFLALVILIFAISAPRFLLASNISSILYSASLLAIVAIAESLVLLTGNYDLSVGSVIGITAYVVLDVTSKVPAFGPFVLVLGLIMGALLGTINGLLVGVLGIPSLVATLGTLSVYRGICSFYAGSDEVTNDQIPMWLKVVAPKSIIGIPVFVWIMIVVLIIVTFILHTQPWGRNLYACGSSAAAAQAFGLDRKRVVCSAYAASGALSGFVGILMGARVGTINSLLGNGYEMTVIAAAVIGGVSLWGGAGTASGAVLGALAYACLDNGLVLLGVTEYVRLIFQGVAIVAAVAIDAVVRKRVLHVGRKRPILEVR